MEWTIEKIRLDLKYTWKISRNASTFKENFIVKCKGDGFEGIGEVAPNIRYNETPKNIAAAFEIIKNNLEQCPSNSEAIETFIGIDTIPNALKFGIESAFLHWHCKKNNITLQQFLGIEKPQHVASCYTLPIMDPSDIKDFYELHNLRRFNFLKVKVNDEDALDMMKEIGKLGNHPLMIDANEAWKDLDVLINFLPKLKSFPVEFIEQPMPSTFEDEYVHLKKHCYLPLMGDESVLHNPNFDLLEKQFDGVNMKLMKAGSYLNGIKTLKEAKKRNMKTMIGCMVETTLGIKSAWDLCSLAQYADLDGCLIIDKEPFHLLIERDGNFYEA